MIEKVIQLETKDGPMNTFLTLPEKDAVNAVVVIQEAFGVNSHIKDLCRRFSKEGYIAMAPELFHRNGNDLVFGYDEFSKLSPLFQNFTNEDFVTDMQACVDYLIQNKKISYHLHRKNTV